MKRAVILAVFLLTVGYGFSAASQVEFVASVKAVNVENPEVATLTMQLTPTYDMSVSVTEMTEIRGEGDVELTVADLAVGMVLKIEGIFTSTGIMAKEIQVFEGVAEFELKGAIESIDTTAQEIKLVGVTVKVTEETEIKDADGNKITLADLQVGQLIKVEGQITDRLVASDIRLFNTSFKPPRIAFEGVITAINEAAIRVLVEGVDEVGVLITDKTEIRGTLAVGAAVRVLGTIQEDLTVAAKKIVVQSALQLAPSKLQQLRPGQVHPVEIILQTIAENDVAVSVVSLDPEIAEVNAETIVIPAGKLVGNFTVLGKSAGETTVEVTLPAELGSMKAVLEVEVQAKGGGDDDDGEVEDQPEISWIPPAVKVPSGHDRGVGLVLKGEVAADTQITLTQVEGPAGLVQFPASVTLRAGAHKVLVVLTAGETPGAVKIQAALPDGGDTADLQVQVRAH